MNLIDHSAPPGALPTAVIAAFVISFVVGVCFALSNP
jgi:hypothetical protein